jgi:hypothetical protein
MENPGQAELLESLDAAHDVHHCVNRADFMERNLVRGTAVYPALGFAQQHERLNRPLPNPGGEPGGLNDGDKVPDPAVRMLVMPPILVVLVPLMMVVVAGVGHDSGRLLLLPSRQDDIHLGRAQPTPIHRLDLDSHLRETEPGW